MCSITAIVVQVLKEDRSSSVSAQDSNTRVSICRAWQRLTQTTEAAESEQLVDSAAFKALFCPENMMFVSGRVAVSVSSGSKMQSPPQTTGPHLLLLLVFSTLTARLLLLLTPNSNLWSPTQSPERSRHQEGHALHHPHAHPLLFSNPLLVHLLLVHHQDHQDHHHLDLHPGSDDEESDNINIFHSDSERRDIKSL